MSDIVSRLRERAINAREEGTMTARCDARHFEEAADIISFLRADGERLASALEARLKSEAVVRKITAEREAFRAENEKLRAALNALIEAADNVRHWHDAMSDNSGMVVSKDSVFALWEEATKARAAAAALKETNDDVR